VTTKNTQASANGAAATGETITVYVNGKPVDLPGRPGGLWPMSAIAHYAYASGVAPVSATAAAHDYEPGQPPCPRPPCGCAPYVRARLKGGEEFDFTDPQDEPPAIAAAS